jgi:hypothetical protein
MLGLRLSIAALTLALTSKNQATQVDVTQHLGEPAEITSDEKGQTVWLYQTRKQIQQGTN